LGADSLDSGDGNDCPLYLRGERAQDSLSLNGKCFRHDRTSNGRNVCLVVAQRKP